MGSFRSVGVIAAVAVGQMLVRHLLQTTTTIPPGFTATNCTTGVYDCSYPALTCTNGTAYVSGTQVTSSSTGNPQSCTNGCAYNLNLYDSPETMLWAVILGGIFAAIMAYFIGGNDAANSWGTSVGSRAIPLKWAVLIGGFFEWLGATALGYGVSGAVTKGVAKTTDKNCWACGYCNSKMGMYSVVMLSALISACIFMFLATFTAFPVSTTHAIIGGVVGGTVVAVGWGCLNWSFKSGLGGIIASWVISPVASGCIAVIVYITTYYLVIQSPFPCGPAKTSLMAMPIQYGLGCFIIVVLIMLKSVPTKGISKGIDFAVGAGAGLVAAAVSAVTVVPFAKKQLELRHDEIHLPGEVPLEWPDQKKDPELNGDHVKSEADLSVPPPMLEDLGTTPSGLPLQQGPTKSFGEVMKDLGTVLKTGDNSTILPSANSSSLNVSRAASVKVQMEDKFAVAEEWTPGQREAIWLYRYLIVFVAALEAFAHGSNDTGNATGAFSAILTTYQQGFYGCKQIATPWYVMTIAGAFVALGVITFGYRVIRTMGEEITNINFHRGFCMEFASAITVVVCTVLSLPVSTTHCQVGAVVFVGCFAFGWRHVAWGMFGKIVLTWVLTIPTSGLLSAAFTAALRPAVTN